jgi:hypothetical protein
VRYASTSVWTGAQPRSGPEVAIASRTTVDEVDAAGIREQWMRLQRASAALRAARAADGDAGHAERAGQRAMWALSGLVSIALGVVLLIRPDIGAISLATVFRLFSVVCGVTSQLLAGSIG